jgi:hypothetical protein
MFEEAISIKKTIAPANFKNFFALFVIEFCL